MKVFARLRRSIMTGRVAVNTTTHDPKIQISSRVIGYSEVILGPQVQSLGSKERMRRKLRDFPLVPP